MSIDVDVDGPERTPEEVLQHIIEEMHPMQDDRKSLAFMVRLEYDREQVAKAIDKRLARVENMVWELAVLLQEVHNDGN